MKSRSKIQCKNTVCIYRPFNCRYTHFTIYLLQKLFLETNIYNFCKAFCRLGSCLVKHRCLAVRIFLITWVSATCASQSTVILMPVFTQSERHKFSKFQIFLLHFIPLVVSYQSDLRLIETIMNARVSVSINMYM